LAEKLIIENIDGLLNYWLLYLGKGGVYAVYPRLEKNAQTSPKNDT